MKHYFRKQLKRVVSHCLFRQDIFFPTLFYFRFLFIYFLLWMFLKVSFQAVFIPCVCISSSCLLNEMFYIWCLFCACLFVSIVLIVYIIEIDPWCANENGCLQYIPFTCFNSITCPTAMSPCVHSSLAMQSQISYIYTWNPSVIS